MKTLLVKHGISVDKIEVLYLFDYLVASNSILKDEDYFSICFAGNLKKSMFLKKMNQLKMFIQSTIYMGILIQNWLSLNPLYMVDVLILTILVI